MIAVDKGDIPAFAAGDFQDPTEDKITDLPLGGTGHRRELQQAVETELVAVEKMLLFDLLIDHPIGEFTKNGKFLVLKTDFIEFDLFIGRILEEIDEEINSMLDLHRVEIGYCRNDGDSQQQHQKKNGHVAVEDPAVSVAFKTDHLFHFIHVKAGDKRPTPGWIGLDVTHPLHGFLRVRSYPVVFDKSGPLPAAGNGLQFPAEGRASAVDDVRGEPTGPHLVKIDQGCAVFLKTGDIPVFAETDISQSLDDILLYPDLHFVLVHTCPNKPSKRFKIFNKCDLWIIPALDLRFRPFVAIHAGPFLKGKSNHLFDHKVAGAILDFEEILLFQFRTVGKEFDYAVIRATDKIIPLAGIPTQRPDRLDDHRLQFLMIYFFFIKAVEMGGCNIGDLHLFP